jgi:hypothetical protein
VNSRLFESFCETIDPLSVKALLRAVEVQHGIIEDDLANRRVAAVDDAQSIASFCAFVVAASRGSAFFCPPLPLEHCAYYRKIVQRMVEAGELPYDAQERFDLNFSQALFKALTSAV